MLISDQAVRQWVVLFKHLNKVHSILLIMFMITSGNFKKEKIDWIIEFSIILFYILKGLCIMFCIMENSYKKILVSIPINHNFKNLDCIKTNIYLYKHKKI